MNCARATGLSPSEGHSLWGIDVAFWLSRWGPNPTFATVQGHSNPNTLFHCTSSGPVVPLDSGSSKMSKICPRTHGCLFLGPFPEAQPQGIALTC